MYSWDYQRPFDGCWFRVISAAFRWTDGRLAHVISSSNINEAKNNELLIKKMAFYDLLTGIPNRRKLEIDLENMIDRARKNGDEVAVLFLDLDNFKAVNDHYGHNGGDVLLKHVSHLFFHDPLTADRCYRYGGDEFIFVFENVNFTQAQNHGKQIIELLETPFELEGDRLSCSGSFGIACYPKDGEDYWELLDKADDEMYASKQHNRIPNRSN